jgi:hypothetical protein
MIAERIKFDSIPQMREQTLTAFFAQEMEADDFIARLSALGIAARAITVIGVALGEPPQRLTVATKPPHLTLYTKKGGIIGILVALLLGVALYSVDFLRLSLLEALLVHTLALVILGGVIGAAVGAILASVQVQDTTTTLPPPSTEGFLVTVKMPVHVVPQGEALARAAGAKKVIC